MILKKILIIALSALFLPLAVKAIPAYPNPMKVVQADGTTLTVLLRGDEHGSMTFTTDGIPLFYNRRTANYEYATLQAGKVAGSGIVAHSKEKRTTNETNYIGRMNIDAICKVAIAERTGNLQKRKAAQRVLINNFPHIGEQHSLVILIEFKNQKFSVVGDDPLSFYTNELNQEGFTHDNGASGSVRDFYIKNSNGAFKPTFDVVGPVTVDHNYSYYGEQNGMAYGSPNAASLLIEACEKLDSTVDFSQYDHDGDGYVDNIYFYYAGYGYADSQRANTIWPHAFNVQGFGLSYETNDGVEIGSYTCSNEINGQKPSYPSGIGTFVHEFGHCLGLADHYDVNYGASSFDPHSWDTMASGSYNNNSNTPPLFSGFERAELGWLDYTTLTSNTDTVTTLSTLGDSNKAYIVRVPNNENEYFILENRQQEGWDKYLPGHGMLVWHIDMDEYTWYSNQVNTDANHQRVDIVEADGKATSHTLSGDPFPGTSNVKQFSFKAWNGNKLFGFNDVAEDNGTITFLLDSAGINIPAPDSIIIKDVADSSFTMEWSPVENANYYLVSLSKKSDNGQLTTLTDYNKKRIEGATSLQVVGLEPETNYHISVKAGVGSFNSEETTADLTTTATPFSKMYVNGLAATEITDNSFYASWNALDGAQTYRVSLFERSFSTDTIQNGYDFSSRSAGFPTGWKTNSSTYQSTEGYYGETAPALRFSSNGGYLRIAYPNNKISHLDFWCRAYPGGDGSKVVIECYKDGEWSETTTFDAPKGGTKESLDFDLCDSVRISFQRVKGYLVIDDVFAGCHNLVHTPLAAYNDLDTNKKLNYLFTGLEPNTTYGLIVRAEENGVKSYPSKELVVTTASATSIRQNTVTDESTLLYNISGQRIEGLQNQKGIYISRKNGKYIKTAIR